LLPAANDDAVAAADDDDDKEDRDIKIPTLRVWELRIILLMYVDANEPRRFIVGPIFDNEEDRLATAATIIVSTLPQRKRVPSPPPFLLVGFASTPYSQHDPE